jgi:DNA repair protein RecO (recombination protein O)
LRKPVVPLYRTQAVVLKSMKLSEKDKLVTFLTENHGKVKCVAKAARRMKSRFGASLEPMSHVSLIYFGKEHQDLYRLNQCDIIQSFQEIKENPDSFYTAVYFLELAGHLVAEAHPEPEIFRLLVRSLQETGEAGSLGILCRLFELRVMAHAGYTPRLRKCISCHKEPQSLWVGFSYNQHGIVCEPCFDKEPVETRIKSGTVNYLKKFLSLDLGHIHRLKVPKEVEAEIESITHRLVLARLGRELKSYPFIQQMAEIAGT